jgi:uncharacterized membrane protein
MTKKMKAYLPRWILRVILPMIVLMWAFITYSAFGTPSGRAEVGLIGWLVVTVVLALVGTMLWLMSSGRLPAYVIEIEDGEESPKR